MFDEDRPKIKLEKNTFDYFIEYSTFLLIIFLSIYTIYYYGNLPEQIPMHFNYSGNVTRYGSKDSIWVLIIIGVLTVLGLYRLNKSPHIFNYPKKITLENAKKQYSDATRVIRFLNLGIALLFTIIGLQVISIAIDNTKQFNMWAHYTILAIIILMTVFPFILIIINLRKKKS